MIHPDSERFDAGPAIGCGVRATRPIPRGTIVWARDRFDLVLSAAALAALPEPHRRLAARYGYRDHRGRCIICWDDGRYVNHSCAPTVRGLGPDLQVAVRDIASGEEITCDYAECNVDPPLRCRCDAPDCRRTIRGSDLLRYADRWDVQVRAAAADAPRVAQPLWPFVLRPLRVRAMLEGRCPVPSLRAVYFDRSRCSGSPGTVHVARPAGVVGAAVGPPAAAQRTR